MYLDDLKTFIKKELPDKGWETIRGAMKEYFKRKAVTYLSAHNRLHILKVVPRGILNIKQKENKKITFH